MKLKVRIIGLASKLIYKTEDGNLQWERLSSGRYIAQFKDGSVEIDKVSKHKKYIFKIKNEHRELTLFSYTEDKKEDKDLYYLKDLFLVAVENQKDLYEAIDGIMKELENGSSK